MSRFARILRIIISVFYGIVLFSLLLTLLFGKVEGIGILYMVLAIIISGGILAYNIVCLVKDENLILNAISGRSVSISWEGVGHVLLIIAAIIFFPITLIVMLVLWINDLVKKNKSKKRKKSYKYKYKEEYKFKKFLQKIGYFFKNVGSSISSFFSEISTKIRLKKYKKLRDRNGYYIPDKVRKYFKSFDKVTGGRPYEHTYEYKNINRSVKLHTEAQYAWVIGDDNLIGNYKKDPKIQAKVAKLEQYREKHGVNDHYFKIRHKYEALGYMEEPEHIRREKAKKAKEEAEQANQVAKTSRYMDDVIEYYKNDILGVKFIKYKGPIGSLMTPNDASDVVIKKYPRNKKIFVTLPLSIAADYYDQAKREMTDDVVLHNKLEAILKFLEGFFSYCEELGLNYEIKIKEKIYYENFKKWDHKNGHFDSSFRLLGGADYSDIQLFDYSYDGDYDYGLQSAKIEAKYKRGDYNYYKRTGKFLD